MPIVDQFMIGQQLRVEDLDQIGQDDIGVGQAIFPIVIAAKFIEPSVVVIDVAALIRRQFRQTAIGGQCIFHCRPGAGVKPKRAVVDLAKDRFDCQRCGAGGFIVGPQVLGAGIG